MFENLNEAKAVLNRKDFQRLHGEMLSVIQDFKRCEANVIRKLQEIDENLVYRFIGYNSLYKYAVEALRLSEAQAYAYVAVARKSAKFPALQAAIESGDLSVSKAVRITSVIDDENQAHWVELAIKGSKREVERAVAGANPEAVQSERVRFIDSHTLNLNLSISEEAFLKLERVRELVSQSTATHASLADALVSALDLYLKQRDPLLKKERKKKVAVSSSATLPGQKASFKPLPRSLKTQVMRRDQAKCQMPMANGEICGERMWLDVHHLIHRANGGGDCLENLIVLCRGHHQMHHQAHAEHQQSNHTRH